MNIFEEAEKDADKSKTETARLAIGGQMWEVARAVGRPRTFETPEDLWNACFEYFDWVRDNPWKEEKVFGSGERMIVDKARYTTLKSLCAYLAILTKTGFTERLWRHYRERAEFEVVCTTVEGLMHDYKMSGATAGMFNPSIVAREMGLVDRREVSEPEEVMTEEQQMAKLESQIPFLKPMLTKMGYRLEKIENEPKSGDN